MLSAAGSYESDARNRGMTKEEASMYGSIMGVMEGASEMVGVSNFLKAGKSLKKGAFREALRSYGLNMADNAIQEAVIDPVDELVAQVASGKTKNDYSTAEGWVQLGKDMVQDGIDGALSAMLMDGVGAGINSSVYLYDKIKNGKNINKQDLVNAYTDIQDNPNIDVEEHFKNSFSYQLQKILNEDGLYTAVNTDGQGNINLTEVMGEPINFNNSDINIKPVVVYDNSIGGYYNIIDGETGTKLDTTPYSNKEEAINGFNEKISKADKATINNINNSVNRTKIEILNKSKAINSNNNSQFYIKTLDNQVYSTKDFQNFVNEAVEKTKKEKTYTPEQFNDITKNINRISDKSIYNAEAANHLFDTVSNNIQNVEVIEQSGNRYINSLDENGRVVYQQKLSNRPYTGKAIKNIVNTAIQNADTTSLYENVNTNNTQTIQEPKESSFYSNSTNYAVQDINKVTEPFSKQENYSKDELADVWNNEVSNNNFDAYYDNNGNIGSYIAIEEEGRDIVVNQYDNQDNIVRSAVIPSDNGRYNSEDVRDTILKVASNTDLNPYIQEMATNFQDDLANTLPGERYKAGDTWTGQKRATTKELADIKDETGASWNKIGEVLDDIANGRKNNTKLARAIENKLDEALSEGYTNIYGKVVNPNEEYLEQKSKVYGRDFTQNNNDYNPEENMTEDDYRIFGMKKNIKTETKSNEVLNVKNNSNHNTSSHMSIFEKEINQYKEKAKKLNKVNKNIVEINTNILDGISKKKQSNFINEYLKNEVRGQDYFVNNQKIIANNTTIGKLKNGRTNFDQRIDKKIMSELKYNVIGNIQNIVENSKIYQKDLPDKKNHSFADTFDRRKAIFKYKNQYYEVMFEIGKKNNINTLYSIEKIKKTSYPTQINKNLRDTKKGIGSTKSNKSIPQKSQSVKTYKEYHEKWKGKHKPSYTNTDQLPENLYNKLVELGVNSKLIDYIGSHDFYNYTSKGRTLKSKEEYESIAKRNKEISDMRRNREIQEREEQNRKQKEENKRKNKIIAENGITEQQYQKEKTAEKYRENKYKELQAIAQEIKGQTSGYYKSKKSIRAIRAELNNKFPASVASQMLGVSQKAIEDNLIPTEWHHSNGALYKAVEYYDISKYINLSENGIEDYINNTEYQNEISTWLKMRKSTKNINDFKDDGVRAMKRNTSNTAVDNQGRTLTKQQQEYFKNSKVRDENGNLLVMYHGTEANVGVPETSWFTIFDIDKAGNHGSMLGDGFYFTSNKSHAEQYAHTRGNIYETYLNIENPLELDYFSTGELAYAIRKINPYIEADIYKRDGTIDGYKVRRYLLDNGYDGIHSGNTYVAFNSNQIKNVTNTMPTEKQDIRYMKKSNNVTDNQGRVLSKQQEEYFKNSKVRDKNGNLKTVYHGTPYDFNTFNYNKLGENTSSLGAGFYFTDTKTTAEQYGNLKEVYVNITKPLSYGKTTMSKNEYQNFITEIDNETNGRYLEDYGSLDEALMEYDYGGDDIDLISAVQTASGLTWDKTFEILKETTGFDGIISYEGFLNKGETLYVAFNSNQIKNVTNKTPTPNKDIRFAKKSARTPKVDGDILTPGQTNAQRASNYIEQEIRKIEETGNWDDTIPVTKMTDIRKTIENYLGIGVQRGHFRQQAYGIYKGNRDVIRTKELKDMDTILHETGHALDIGKRIKIDKESISNELLTAVKKYGGYEAETRNVQLEEGFAEVIREYAIVPDQARTDYPQTVAVLEGIRQTDKDFNNFITTVQQQTYNYIHQNPVNRGGLSNMSIGERTDKPVLTPEYVKQVIIEKAWDSNYTIKRATQVLKEVSGNKELRASDNAYLLTRLVSGIGDKVSSMLANGYIDENGNRLFPGLNQVGEILNNDETKFNNLRAYLVARRHMDYIAKDLKTGIRTNDAKAIIEQFENDTQIQEAAKVIYDTLDGVLQYAVNNKLITEENAEALRESNAFYVPFQRVIGNNGNNVGRKGAVADIIKGRTGSELDIKDVLENIITNSANIIQQVENNKIINALYTQGENAGLTGAVYDEIDPPMKKVGVARLDMWEKELENQGIDIGKIDFDKTIDIFVPNNNIDERNQIVSFIDNMGQRRYLQFHDQMLFKTLTGLDRESSQWFLNLCNNLNKPLRYGATLANLGFALPNMLSDTVQATIYSEAGFIPFIDTAIGAIDVLTGQSKMFRNFMNKVAPEYAQRVNTMYELYRQTGSTSATKIGQERKSAQKIMKDIYGTKNSKVLGINDRMAPLKRLLDIMTYIPELSEQSTRFRVFEKNLEYYRRNGMSEIDARMEAAIQARDATQDFSRMGTAMREVNKIIPFSAARVGSAYTFAEKMKANPKRTSARIALMLALNMALKSLTSDDDEINELNQRKKDDNFVFKVGDQVITIKKPQGFLRSLINLNDYIMDLANGNIDEGKEGERLKEWLFNAIMDNSVADDITGMVPSAITPVLENAINKDLYYNSDIVKSYDLELPDSEQYYDYNSQLAIWLGGIFNYSPAKIDNFISGYFAGLGTQVTNIIDWIVGKTGATPEEPNMGLEANSVGKRFFVNVNSNSQSVDDVYTLKTELKKKENGDTITADETQQLNALEEATTNMAKLNKQIKEIKKNLTLSADEKAEQIRVLQEQKTDVARQALGKDLLYSTNSEIENMKFYPSKDTMSKNKRTLTLTTEMKKEYEQVASEYYEKYEKQGLYSKEKLEQIESKAKDYAKNYMFKKYKDKLQED